MPLIIQGARTYLQYAIKSVAIDYRETLSISDLNLLPLTYTDYIGVAIGVLFVAWVLGAVVLFFTPLRRCTHPAVLFQE